MKNFNPNNINLNRDETIMIDNKIETAFDSMHYEISDLKGNGKDWIADAVSKGFKKVLESDFQRHEECLKKHDKKLKIHDWWLWAVSLSIIIISLILIFA